MCRNLVILFFVCIIGYFPTIAKAEVLTEKQLDRIYAGDFDTDINDDVAATSSAVSSQKNIAGIGSTQGTLRNNDIRNTNRANVRNEGDSAVAFQTNIGVIGSLGSGENRNNDIRNTNIATVNNRVSQPSGSVDAALEGDANSGTANNSASGSVLSSKSAVAQQTNLGTVAVLGTARNTDIINRNQATVRNEGDSAVGLQTNIGIISSLQAAENRDNDIRNTNRVTLNNRLTDTNGSVEAEAGGTAITGIEANEILITAQGANEVLSGVTASNSAVAEQTNVAVIAVGGTLRNSDTFNDNFASITNRGDSAVALQANIAAITAQGAGENLNNDIRNSNTARINNRVTGNTGSVEGSLGDNIVNGMGTNSLFSSVTGFQSAIATQDNIGVVSAEGSISRTSIRNSNDARVTNSP